MNPSQGIKAENWLQALDQFHLKMKEEINDAELYGFPADVDKIDIYVSKNTEESKFKISGIFSSQFTQEGLWEKLSIPKVIEITENCLPSYTLANDLSIIYEALKDLEIRSVSTNNNEITAKISALMDQVSLERQKRKVEEEEKKEQILQRERMAEQARKQQQWEASNAEREVREAQTFFQEYESVQNMLCALDSTISEINDPKIAKFMKGKFKEYCDIFAKIELSKISNTMFLNRIRLSIQADLQSLNLSEPALKQSLNEQAKKLINEIGQTLKRKMSSFDVSKSRANKELSNLVFSSESILFSRFINSQKKLDVLMQESSNLNQKLQTQNDDLYTDENNNFSDNDDDLYSSDSFEHQKHKTSKVVLSSHSESASSNEREFIDILMEINSLAEEIYKDLESFDRILCAFIYIEYMKENTQEENQANTDTIQLIKNLMDDKIDLSSFIKCHQNIMNNLNEQNNSGSVSTIYTKNAMIQVRQQLLKMMGNVETKPMTWEEIRTCYKRWALQNYPDKVAIEKRPEATAIFQNVMILYSQLEKYFETSKETSL